MRQSRRILGFERLEERLTLNGTVIVSGDLNTFGAPVTIQGDAAANNVFIHEFPSHVPPGSGRPSVELIQIEGIGTNVKSQLTIKPIRNGSTITFTIWSHPLIIQMGGGNDTLVIQHAVQDGMSIDMGAGNDILRMNNVTIGYADSDALSVIMGDGADVAVLNNVYAEAGIHFNAGAGRDIVRLNSVTAGRVGGGDTLSVEMGSGTGDQLRVLNSAADHAVFNDTGGVKGVLLLGGYDIGPNKFGDETNSGFNLAGLLTHTY